MSIDVNGYWIGSKNLPHLIRKAGFTRKTAQAGAVTLIQRFGSALNLNVHFHMLFLDRVYIDRADGGLRFCWVKAPTSAELNQLTQTLARRIGRYLERPGLLEWDAENSYLASDAVGDDGVFAPNSQHRALVTPAKRGRGNKAKLADEQPTARERRASMSWAQRLKRVFNIDIETCRECGGAVKVIACIEDPVEIKQILDHLKNKGDASEFRTIPETGRHRLGCLTDEPENQQFRPVCCAHVTAARIRLAGSRK
jgi:hypothetical protein